MHNTAPSPTTQPALFVGHGNPMHAIDDNPFKLAWQAWGQRLRTHYPNPRAILLISAHWMTQGWQITTAKQPRTIHDFGGFPAELFAQQYPAPGSPGIAEEIIRTLPQLRIQSDDGQWGLDHGAWAVLMHLFPQAHEAEMPRFDHARVNRPDTDFMHFLPAHLEERVLGHALLPL